MQNRKQKIWNFVHRWSLRPKVPWSKGDSLKLFIRLSFSVWQIPKKKIGINIVKVNERIKVEWIFFPIRSDFRFIYLKELMDERELEIVSKSFAITRLWSLDRRKLLELWFSFGRNGHNKALMAWIFDSIFVQHEYHFCLTKHTVLLKLRLILTFMLKVWVLKSSSIIYQDKILKINGFRKIIC